MELTSAISVLKTALAHDLAAGQPSEGADGRAADFRTFKRYGEERAVAFDQHVIVAAALEVDVRIAVAIDGPEHVHLSFQWKRGRPRLEVGHPFVRHPGQDAAKVLLSAFGRNGVDQRHRQSWVLL